jgi:hypothetical protein
MVGTRAPVDVVANASSPVRSPPTHHMLSPFEDSPHMATESLTQPSVGPLGDGFGFLPLLWSSPFGPRGGTIRVLDFYHEDIMGLSAYSITVTESESCCKQKLTTQEVNSVNSTWHTVLHVTDLRTAKS